MTALTDREALVFKSAWKALADPSNLLHDIIATPANIYGQLQPPTRKSARLNLVPMLAVEQRLASRKPFHASCDLRILARLALSQQINAILWLTSLS